MDAIQTKMFHIMSAFHITCLASYLDFWVSKDRIRHLSYKVEVIEAFYIATKLCEIC